MKNGTIVRISTQAEASGFKERINRIGQVGQIIRVYRNVLNGATDFFDVQFPWDGTDSDKKAQRGRFILSELEDYEELFKTVFNSYRECNSQFEKMSSHLINIRQEKQEIINVLNRVYQDFKKSEWSLTTNEVIEKTITKHITQN